MISNVELSEKGKNCIEHIKDTVDKWMLSNGTMSYNEFTKIIMEYDTYTGWLLEALDFSKTAKKYHLEKEWHEFWFKRMLVGIV